MAKAKIEVNEKAYYKDIYFLYEILSKLKSVEEVKIFLKDMLTKSELRMFKRRWHIAGLLSQGLNIREVAGKSKTSTQTVSKVKGILDGGYGGLRIAINRVGKNIEKQKKESIRNKSSKGGSRFIKGWLK